MQIKKHILILAASLAAFGQQAYMVWHDHLGGPDSPQYYAFTLPGK